MRLKFESCFETQFREELENRGFIKNKDFVQEFPIKYPTRIIDFVFYDKKVGIELDGPHHIGKKKYVDKWKDEKVTKQGWVIIRFDMEQMKDVKNCVDVALSLIK